jgi:hypothetical protein
MTIRLKTKELVLSLIIIIKWIYYLVTNITLTVTVNSMFLRILKVKISLKKLKNKQTCLVLEVSGGWRLQFKVEIPSINLI